MTASSEPAKHPAAVPEHTTCPHTTCLICFGEWAYGGADGICADCRARLAPVKVTNVLGETRRAPSVWPDGAWTCPFCGGAAVPSDRWFTPPCANPMCEAHPLMSPDEVLRRRAEQEQRELDAQERRRSHELAMARIAADKALRAREVQQVREAGYYVQCFVRSGQRKRIRHRTLDYHE